MRRLPVLVFAALALGGCSEQSGSPVVGTLQRDRIALVAERSEPIETIAVREGERITAGTEVLRLDGSRARAERDRLQAQLEEARQRLGELVRGPRQEVIDQAEARLRASASRVKQARRELARVQRLRAQDASSEQALDSARTQVETAVAERDAARAELAALRAGNTAEQIAQARAAVTAAEAALREQAVTLERLSLESPRAARVEALPFAAAETPPAGATVAVLRALDEPPHARVYVPAALRARLQPGARVEVVVEGHGTHAGHVRFLASEAAYTPYYALTEHETGRLSYLAEVELPQAGELPTGLPVRVVVPPGEPG